MSDNINPIRQQCIIEHGDTIYIDVLPPSSGSKRPAEGSIDSLELKRYKATAEESLRRLERAEASRARTEAALASMLKAKEEAEAAAAAAAEQLKTLEASKLAAEQAERAAKAALDAMSGTCAICMDKNLGAGSSATVALSCSHTFHLSCLEGMIGAAASEVSRVFKSRDGGVITCQFGINCPCCRAEVFPKMSSAEETEDEKTLGKQITWDVKSQLAVLEGVIETATKRRRPPTPVPASVKQIMNAAREPGKVAPSAKLLPNLIKDTHVVACCSADHCKKAFLMEKQCAYPERVYCWSCDAAGASTNLPRWSTTAVVHCDRCDQAVERSGGCSHMTCTPCGYEWCQVCGGKFSGWLSVDTGSRSVNTIPFCFSPDNPQELNRNGKPYRFGACGCLLRTQLEQERGIVRPQNLCLGAEGTIPGWGFQKMARSALN